MKIELPFFAGKEIPKEYLKVYFFNRKKEVEELSRKLKSTPAVNIALYGERRVGKTSLLEKIAVELEKECVPILIKCEKLVPLRQLTFLQNIANELLKEYRGLKKVVVKTKKAAKALKPERIGFGIEDKKFWMEFGEGKVSLNDAFAKVFELVDEICKSKNRKVVVFLDEFQELFKFGDEFLWALRAHIADSDASFVVSSSYHRFKEKLTDAENPFFNFFEIYHITAVPKAEAEKYLKKRIAEFRMEFTDEVVEKIIDVSKLNPFYLQLLGLKCYDTALRRAKKIIDAEIFSEAMKDALENIPTYTLAPFQRLRGNARDIFISMCLYDLDSPTEIAKKVKISPKNVIVVLNRIIEDTGLIKKVDEGKYKVVDSFLKEYVRKNFAASA